MDTFLLVPKTELDFDTEVKAQLTALVRETRESEEDYLFLPEQQHRDTFLWVLETNHIPYQVSAPSASS
ncbi:MAG: hypothetical protein KME05_24835 [Gloeocapsa sp. UFS-A4-WI-NPMV-4B04]|jgi:hypothetical protein|nr:hypothetical protein [Gloeocapsa sp. UFS-A4-WI-NPMV-4B04]